MKKIAFKFILILLVFTITGCGVYMKTPVYEDGITDEKEDNSGMTAAISVQVKISDENGNTTFAPSVELYDGNTTVIDALKTLCEDMGFTFEYEKEGRNTMIDLLSGDVVIGSSRNVFYQGSIEWYYYVNGEKYLDPDTSADTYNLNDGDSLEWTYYSQSEISEYQTEAVYETTEEFRVDRIEADLPSMDFGNKEIIFLVGSESRNPADIYVEEENGEVINDTMYRRNMEVEAEYNVQIKQEITPDGKSKFRKVVLSDDNYYSVFIPRLSDCTALASDGMFMDLNSVPYLDFSKPWWQTDAANELRYKNTLYFMTGDIVFQNYNAVSAVLFNKKLTMDYGLESEYDLVMNGLWTIDKLIEMSKSVTMDLNGDGRLDIYDQYGLIAGFDSPTSFYLGSAEMLFNNPDSPVVAFTNKNSEMVWDKIFNMLHNEWKFALNAIYYVNRENGSSQDIYNVFTEDRALFFSTNLNDVPYLRARQNSGAFGVLPVPKYDLPQSRYRSAIDAEQAYAVAVPLSNTDLETTGIILEAMGAASSNYIMPALYELYLRSMYVRDEESSAMLDIILANIVYDIGNVGNFGNVNNELKQTMLESDANIMGLYEKVSDSIASDINKYISRMEELLQ